jgi:NADP-dependent 3-hydroxy acid dehydrogenase YdfG
MRTAPSNHRVKTLHISLSPTCCCERAYRQIPIKPDAIARAVLFAIEQAPEVDVSEIIVRPTASMF